MNCDGVYGCLRNRLLPDQDVRINGKKMVNANEGAAPYDLILSKVAAPTICPFYSASR